jgi:AMP-binding enzyme
VGESQLNTMLDDAIERHYCRPAVVCDGHETDYERFAESVEWLAGDLDARGVQPGQRIGLCMTSGWEYLLALHALVRLDVVVVPIDPCDGPAQLSARALDLHYLVSHRATDALLEEIVVTICGDDVCPMFGVAEEFTLVVVSAGAPLHDEGGVIVNDSGYQFCTSSEVVEKVRCLQVDLELDSDAGTVICGLWTCPSAVLLVLACAASGSRIHVVPDDSGSSSVWRAVAAGDVSVVFAQPMLMHELVRTADLLGRSVIRPRMVLPDGEELPEVILRRRRLTRKDVTDPPVYTFGAAAASTVSDFDCACCGSAGLLTVS